ncbi:MAG: hypothetical protein GY797_26235 [Deltaproteobacteria bacterium]|nr:hypothetical protein [Deltaproteobacteria bacterium]
MSKKLTIEEMREIAEKLGGKCLSDTYVNTLTKLLWECKQKHRWEAIPNNVKRGKWCPICAGSVKRTIEEMQSIAEKRGGKCLSAAYENARTNLLWECREKHHWEATPTNIKSGKWCRRCAGLMKLTIEKMQLLAEERGGKCLSKSYVNTQTKLLWECKTKHRWKATPNNIKRGRWCQKCSSGLGERICIEFFEQIFRRKFPRSYPTWLINKNGNQMELDGYSQPLRIAFEHQGEQHYSTKGIFLKSEKDLQERQQDDRDKVELCKLQGVTLIVVPEIPNRLPIQKVKAFIKKECVVKNIPLPSDYDKIIVNLKKAYTTSTSVEALKELQGIAKKHGGKCLSGEYIYSKINLLWECNEGHRWLATPDNIKKGSWCQSCFGSVKGTIEEMQAIARKNGGKCLSVSYVDNRTKLLWECAKGHQWKAVPYSVKSGAWCRKCYYTQRGISRRLSIEDMQVVAKQRGGKCLSDTYENNQTKLLWECAAKHQWRATPAHVKHGTWCKICADKQKGISQRLSIEDMQTIAKQRGGKCLSDTYVDAHTSLLWVCKEKHQWMARPHDVKNGNTWCPFCWGKVKELIEDMQTIAKQRGGKCLSDTYVNAHTKLLWECAKGHQWKAVPYSVKHSTWCKKCANKRKRIS